MLNKPIVLHSFFPYKAYMIALKVKKQNSDYVYNTWKNIEAGLNKKAIVPIYISFSSLPFSIMVNMRFILKTEETNKHLLRSMKAKRVAWSPIRSFAACMAPTKRGKKA
jgi:hypothetical protein